MNGARPSEEVVSLPGQSNVTCKTLLPDALRKTWQETRRLVAVQCDSEGSLLASQRQEHELLQDHQVQWRLPGR